MAYYDTNSNKYILSKADKFRLLEIRHKSVECISLVSTFIMPFCVSAFAIGEFGLVLGLLYWWFGLRDNAIWLFVATVIHWVIGVVLGIIGQVFPLLWLIYLPLFIITFYYLICNLLEDRECKRGETPLELLYKENKIK